MKGATSSECYGLLGVQQSYINTPFQHLWNMHKNIGFKGNLSKLQIMSIMQIIFFNINYLKLEINTKKGQKFRKELQSCHMLGTKHTHTHTLLNYLWVKKKP